ncbi:MAG: FAD-binding protein [Deltaproteobacteria bacterium]|nr:FAD-binding protein [Deltaproteobacteria bacterium]MBW2412869.1 FAD-binding protein [Deltaproteobacteria bacterium]
MDPRTGELVDRLRELPSVEDVLAGASEMFVYESDGLTLTRGRAAAVAFPSTTRAVCEIVRACNEFGVPFVPRGAGTGLSGGATPVDGCVVIECARMDQVLSIDAVNRTATVQPGLVNAHLTDAVSGLGLHYAPDPSSQTACTIGGNVAENSGGPHTLKYGTTSPHVLSLEVVLPDASVVQLGRRDAHAVGYDLRGVFVGSEGTLGIVTAATVRLMPDPETVCTLLASFPSLVSACEAVSTIIAAGIVASALELLDDKTIDAVEASVFAAGYPRNARAVLLVELDGTDAAVQAERARVRTVCQSHGAIEVRVARDEQEREAFWRGRKGAFGAMGRRAPDLYVHDAVVPRTRLPEVVEAITRAAEERNLRIANVFHAGDGNLHPNLSFDRRDADELARIVDMGEEILRICIEAGGVLSGEHGIGLEKRDYMHMLYTDEDLEPMRWVHEAFDPADACNPGKVIPQPRACTESNPRHRGYEKVTF